MTPYFWIAALIALFLLGNRRLNVDKRTRDLVKGDRIFSEGVEISAKAMERLRRIPANLREISGKPHIGASLETQSTWLEEIDRDLSQGQAMKQNGIMLIGGGGTGND